MKRILRRIRLDKIAAVDQPCQQHATVAIIKRAPTPEVISKATFQEALDAAQLSSAVNRAFWDSFDNLWAQNDAFREALTDELSEGGDGSVASAAYIESVQSLVERAVNHAREAGAEEADAIEKILTKSAAEWLAAKSKPKGEVTMKITSKTALRAEIAKFDPETTPAAHVEIIRKAATDLGAEDELPTDGPLAKAKQDPALAKALSEIAVLKLSPEAKSFYDGLDEAGQTAFIGKSKADQDADVAKANETDPVVYKTARGLEIRKSDGATALALAKQGDEQAEELAKLRGTTETDAFEKRAETEFGKVAKSTAVDMLRSAAAAPGGEAGETGQSIVKSLKTMNDAADPMFKRHGHSGSEPAAPAGIQKARATFGAEVEKIAKRDSIGRSAAMDKAEKEHPDLFAEAYPEAAPAEAIEE